MTRYADSDLSQDWEFKILRSATGSFRKPEFLRRALEEEAQAGWMLVEKFDNSRVRLKRPAKARELDGKLNTDPYRTYVGISELNVALLVIGTVLAVLAVFILIVTTVVH